MVRGLHTSRRVIALVTQGGAQSPIKTRTVADVTLLRRDGEIKSYIDLFFLAASPAMKQIHAQVALVAKVDVAVLLLGESGVGKEVLARLIH